MQKTLFAKILKGVSLFTLMLPLIGLQSCKDDPHNYDEPKVSIEPTPQNNTFVFEQTAGSNELTIKTNRKWSISTSGEDWFAITPTSGEVGEHKITVTVLANEEKLAKDSLRLQLRPRSLPSTSSKRVKVVKRLNTLHSLCS